MGWFTELLIKILIDLVKTSAWCLALWSTKQLRNGYSSDAMTFNRTTLTRTTISVIVVAVTVPPDVTLLYVVLFFYFLKNEILDFSNQGAVPFGQHVIISTVVSNTKRTNLPNPT
jgi:hypothetical protein